MSGGDLRMTGGERRRIVQIAVDGQTVTAREGESVAAALIAAGHRVMRWTARGEPRGYFCGIGICRDCLVIADGQPDTRACMTPVREGLRVESPRGPSAPAERA
jgi:D-hydroxyproline dehydrogenase subunit gamma